MREGRERPDILGEIGLPPEADIRTIKKHVHKLTKDDDEILQGRDTGS